MSRARSGEFRALAGFLAGLALCGASCPDTAAAKPKYGKPTKYVLKLGTAFAPGHILVDASQKFKELIEADTRGRIEVQITTAADTVSPTT